MSRTLSNPTFYNAGKPAFGNTFESSYASDYLKNKKAKLLYANNYTSLKVTGRLGSQNNYLLYDRAKLIRNVETCATTPAFNKANLVSGLYTTENLGSKFPDLSGNNITGSVNVVTANGVNGYNDASCNIFSATAINRALIYPATSTVPFYYKYNIDPCGELFGNTPCGIDNYEKFRIYSKPVINTRASLTGCNPVCFDDVCNKVCPSSSFFFLTQRGILQ
jgi:hypothetical protein